MLPIKKYRIALARAFPDLAITKLEYLAEGWDSVVLVANGEWLFRFPKRDAVAARLFEVEVPLLAVLGAVLPLPGPRFEFLAPVSPSKNIKPFVGYRMLPGEPLDDQSEILEQADWWKPTVASFLAALHSFPLDTATALGVRPFVMLPSIVGGQSQFLPDTSRWGGCADWRAALEDFYAAIRRLVLPALSGDVQAAIVEQFEMFLATDCFFQFQPSLLHGDFSPEHVLLDRDSQRVSGIIDFGEVGWGDPAYDLWESLLPYYPVPPSDQTFAARCRFYKKLLPLHVLLFGHAAADPALVEYGRYELQRLWFNRDEVL